MEEETGVEEVGRLAAAFERVGAEGEDVGVEAGLEESGFVGGGGRTGHGFFGA